MPIPLKELEENARGVAQAIDATLNGELKGITRKIGFVLLLFDFGENGSMTYLSNGQRADVIKALRECVATMETQRDVPPHGKGG